MPYEQLHHPHHGVFGNREVTSLYIMLAILTFGMSMVSVFVPVFIWQIGYEIWEVVLFYFLRSVYFVVLAFALLPLLRRMSDKLMMAIGIPFLILFFFGLSRLDGQAVLFWILPAAWALYLQLFWVGFHLDFSGSADEDQVGREVGLRNLFMSLSQFAAPVVGGFLIAATGFRNVFMISSALLVLSVLPLFFFPQRKMPRGMKAANIFGHLTDRRTRPYTVSAVAFAAEKMVVLAIWPIFIFIVVGGVERFGLLYSSGLLLAAVTTYLMGELSDRGAGQRIMNIAVPFYAAVWFFRVLVFTPALIIGSHVAGAVGYSALRAPWGSLYYRVIRKMPHPGTFIFSLEIFFHLVRIVFLGALVLLAWLLPEDLFFSVSFIAAGLVSILYLSSNRQSLRALARSS